MKRIYVILFALICAVGCCNAQVIHEKGKMGLGFRGGISSFIGGIKEKCNWHRGYNLGLFYNYCLNDRLSLIAEVDHEKLEYEYSNYNNPFLLGIGCEYAVWKPTKWLYINLSYCANIGYEVWDCKVMDWTERHLIGGVNGGFAIEAYPCHFLSFVGKTRQFVLYGKGMSDYLKPDVSLGIKVNW